MNHRLGIPSEWHPARLVSSRMATAGNGGMILYVSNVEPRVEVTTRELACSESLHEGYGYSHRMCFRFSSAGNSRGSLRVDALCCEAAISDDESQFRGTSPSSTKDD